MSRLALLISAVAVQAGCKDSPPSGSAGGSGSAVVSVAGPGSARVAPVGELREGPSLPAATDAGPDTPALAFDDESRDDGWAPTLEADLTKRLATLPHAKLASVECRSAQCRLAIRATDDAALSSASSELETALRASPATSIVLAAPTTSGDRRELVVYARFDR
jgi:hypothetical protein